MMVQLLVESKVFCFPEVIVNKFKHKQKCVIQTIYC